MRATGEAKNHDPLLKAAARDPAEVAVWRLWKMRVLEIPREAPNLAARQTILACEMTESATPEYLMKGAAYALEQCGLCLRDASLLYRNKRYANALVLAAFAREALGQWIILLDLRQKVLDGEEIPASKLRKLYDDHELKQTAAMLSFTMTGDRDTGVGKLIVSRIMALPGTADWKRTDDALKKLNKLKAKRVPQDRHKLRMLAMYIDPEGDDWNRPARPISPANAREFIEEARNDYAVQRLNRYNNFQKDEEAELFKALEQWSDRPKLPLPPGRPLF